MFERFLQEALRLGHPSTSILVANLNYNRIKALLAQQATPSGVTAEPNLIDRGDR